MRAWPFHAHETGATAEDSWVARFFFVSKYFQTAESASYRLDPFLFRFRTDRERLLVSFLFEVFAYDETPTETSLRVPPFFFGHWSDTAALNVLIPLLYARHYDSPEIDEGDPWRFFLPLNSLTSTGGERYFSFLWKVFEYADHAQKDDFFEYRLFHRVIWTRQTETSRHLEVLPFYVLDRDDSRDRSYFNIPLLLGFGGQTDTQGQTQYSLLFGLIDF
jgi:hypothetical protein